MQYSKIADVTSDVHRWTVKARIVRFSEYATQDTPPKILRLDMVLIDEEVKQSTLHICSSKRLSYGQLILLFIPYHCSREA
jgi:hypothetical protein